jgi:phosphate transport system substrate-binding protein
LALLVLASSAHAADVRLNGATTTVDRVVGPYATQVEKVTGHKLVVLGNGTGKGLADLAAGRCDASLSSEPIEIALDAAKVAGTVVSPSSVQFHVLRHDEIVFIVNPTNPVTSLSWDQLRAIHTGQIRNWREVGGKDMPITVFTDTVTGGTRAMIKRTVLGGAEYASTCVALTTVRKVADMVAADSGGIGGLGRGFYDPSRTKLVQTAKLERPLGIITKGSPSPSIKAVIDAFRVEIKKAGQ